MPTYLLHGFRWPRPLIRIHIILQNLDDAAAEWLMAPATTSTLLSNFATLYPALMPSLPHLRFIEQYDPADESSASTSQPYAYVADVVHEVALGVDVDEVRGKGVGNEAWEALMELRDAIAPGERVAWFVVVCGDVERWAPPTVGLLEGNGGTVPTPLMGGGGGSPGGLVGSVSGGSGGSGDVSGSFSSGAGGSYGTEQDARSPSGRGLKNWFGKGLRKVKSSKSLRRPSTSGSQFPTNGAQFSTPPPPLPKPVPGTAV